MAERILIADDDRAMREALRMLLEDEGFEVVAASSGYEAIQMAKEVPCDLVIADVRMPGIDGLKALSDIRTASPQTRGIVITGFADTGAPLEALKLGVDDYLMKPFDNRILVEAVKRSLQRYRTAREHHENLSRANESVLAVLKVIASALESQNPWLEGHGRRVAAMACETAKRLEVPAERRKLLEAASYLHDLGKIRIKQSILNRAEALLEEEYLQLRGQSDMALEILGPLKGFRTVLQIMLHHHEWFNGEGYPHGLAGESIPLESRILAVTEAFDSLTSQRPHRAAMNASDALQILRSEAGSRYDPSVVDTVADAVRAGDFPCGEGRDEDGLPDEEDLTTLEKRKRFLLSLAQTYLSGGEGAIAQKAFEECLEICGDAKDLVRATALAGLARLYFERGDLQAARMPMEEALQMVRLDENCDAARIALTGALLAENAARAEELLALAQKTFSWWESADDFITLALYRAALYARSDLPTGRTDRFAEALGAFLAEAEKGKYEPAQAGERALAARVLNQAAGKGLLSGYGEKLRALVAGEGRAEAGSRTIRIFSFGKFRVHVGGNLVGAKDWKTRKSEYLLAFLASRGHAASEEKIIDTFWPDSAPDKAKQSLYTAVSYVKDALRNPHAVEKGRGFYSFNRNLSYRLDTEEFDLACREGAKMEAEGRRDEAAALYRNAESLCTGEFLEGYSEDWAVELREHYCVRHLDLIMRLAEHYHERQKFDVSVAYCQKALEQDPLHQGAFLLLMRSYNSLGRNEEVVRVYQRCCKVLKDELNIAPSMDIINLYVRAGA